MQQLLDIQARIEHALDRYLPLEPCAPVLADAMRYSCLGGGKRIRGVLVLSFARHFGVDETDAMPFAAAVEMIHAYSLIHDDLPCMDNDDMRRGKPSCHKAYGEAMALLAGDTLLTRAFEVACAESGVKAEYRLAAVAKLAQAAGLVGMAGGQSVEIGGGLSDGQALLDMYAMKTGALIRVSCELGALLAGKDDPRVTRYGRALGLAFQLVDDLQDDDETTTYVSLMGREATQSLAAEQTELALTILGEMGQNDAFLTELTRYLLGRTD